MIGLMKKAICITLAMIGGMSRNRAQSGPSSRHTARPSTTHINTPGSAASETHPGHTL